MRFIAFNKMKWIALMVFVFSTSLLFFYNFYISRIISDTSAHYIYGELIYENFEFFPKDFYYANDIFFLRPHYIIAILLALGITGFKNYALACSFVLAIGVCAVAYIILRLLKLSFWQACIIAIAVFLPFGYTEYEFILAQQSHLQQTVITLVSTLFLYAAFRTKKEKLLIPTAVGIFLLAWDSPLRSLLLLAAYIWSALLIRIQWSLFFRMTGILSISFIIGACINKSIDVTIHGVQSKLVLAHLSDIAIHLQMLIQNFLSEYLGTEDFAEFPLNAFTCAALLAKSLICIALLIAFLQSLIKSILMENTQKNIDGADFVNLVGAIICMCGLCISLITYIDADVRHFLPGIILIKLAICIRIFGSLTISKTTQLLAGAVLILALAVVPKIIYKDLQKQDHTSDIENDDFAHQIRLITEQNNLAIPVTLYGTFGNIVAFEILMPDLIHTAPITYANDELHIYKWLSRPSRYCLHGSVLIMAESDDKGLETLIQKLGGLYVGKSFDKAIYKIEGRVLQECKTS